MLSQVGEGNSGARLSLPGSALTLGVAASSKANAGVQTAAIENNDSGLEVLDCEFFMTIPFFCSGNLACGFCFNIWKGRSNERLPLLTERELGKGNARP